MFALSILTASIIFQWWYLYPVGNNHIEIIPPEIGLLHNLVELSVGGNHLVYIFAQRLFVAIELGNPCSHSDSRVALSFLEVPTFTSCSAAKVAHPDYSPKPILEGS